MPPPETDVKKMTDSYHIHQKYLLLNLINYLGPVSRTKLTELSGYRPASVGAITKELLEERLLIETGFYSTGHGRKRTLLSINKELLCAVGVSFFSDNVCIVAMKYTGDILHREEIPFSLSMPLPTLAAQIESRLSALLATYRDYLLVGVGLGDPIYNQAYYRSHDISYDQFNTWLHETLKPRLARILPIPVSSFSAVALPALVERRFGVAKGCDNFLCVELSGGIGSSICCNGNVLTGACNSAGEIGHTVVELDSEDVCYCGKSGCVEHAAAFPAVSAEILRSLEQGVYSELNGFYDRQSELTVQHIRRAVEQGDHLCRRVVKRSAARIGAAIANAVNLLNPELVVLYGFMLELGDYFLDQLTDAIRENVLTFSAGFAVRTSPGMESMLPLGAASEMFSAYLRVHDYAWVYTLRPTENGADEQ